MYKLQVVDALTKETFREKTYKKPDLLLSLLETATNGQECILFDEKCKTFKGDYVTHDVRTEEDMVVYKVLFELKESEIQARSIH